MRTRRLALCQVKTRADRQTTLLAAETMVRQAAEAGADLAVLPEMFFCPYAAEAFPRYAETAEGPAAAAMADWAVRFGVTVVGGSLPERDGERLYNTCFVFGPDGRRLARYRKAHLFDVDLADGTSFRESDTFSPGDEICVFDAAGCRIGLAICFDLRFPELIRAMAVRGGQKSAVRLYLLGALSSGLALRDRSCGLRNGGGPADRGDRPGRGCCRPPAAPDLPASEKRPLPGGGIGRLRGC